MPFVTSEKQTWWLFPTRRCTLIKPTLYQCILTSLFKWSNFTKWNSSRSPLKSTCLSLLSLTTCNFQQRNMNSNNLLSPSVRSPSTPGYWSSLEETNSPFWSRIICRLSKSIVSSYRGTPLSWLKLILNSKSTQENIRLNLPLPTRAVMKTHHHKLFQFLFLKSNNPKSSTVESI